jgi:hypothetical protein
LPCLGSAQPIAWDGPEGRPRHAAADRAIAEALNEQIQASEKDGEDRSEDDDGLSGALVPAG